MKFWMPIFQETPISGMTHPDYDLAVGDWQKFRATFLGGDQFINDYLEQFSARENFVDYYKRRKITYCPAHAKSAILEIKNAIYQRMIDITRTGGTDSYAKTIIGELDGVDFNGNTMNSFIGSIVLPDLLSIGKVGVYVDREPIDIAASRSVTFGSRPYLYKYDAEDILSWKYERNRLLTLLLQDHIDVVNPTTGLVTGTKVEYRLMKLVGNGVSVTIYDGDSKEIAKSILKLKAIPFVIFEISQSLLTDVANYQIALLNLASSDMNYALKANFPFYTEQYDALTDMTHLRQALTDPKTLDGSIIGSDGEAVQGSKAKDPEIRVGVTQGRRYPKGLERPGFINPSAEPLNASMAKQDQLKLEIRQLVHLSLQTVTSKSVTQDSNEHGLESGLSNIGLELEFGERQIATLWQQYEGKTGAIVIKYPNSYSLRTDDDRRKEVAELRTEMSSNPSMTYQKEIAKQIATVILGHKVTQETLKKIHAEIDTSLQVIATVDDIVKDHENGFVSTATASKIRGYKEGEAELAKKDHAERAARIVAAQTAAARLKNPASRGVDDLDDDIDSSKKEKKVASDDTLDVTLGKNVRGQGK